MGKKRRSYGQGTIRCRSGSWSIGYRPVPGGRRVWETIGPESAGVTREVAEHALLERLVAIGRGQGSQFLGHPFEVVAREWQRSQIALKGLSTRAQELLEVALDCHLLPAFRGLYLHQISAGDIERYAAKKLTLAPGEPGAVPVEGKVASSRTEPLGIRSVEQQLSVLRQIFTYAKREGLVAENPVSLVELSSNPRTKKQIVPMEQEDVRAILKHSVTEERETLLLTMASLGLRLGELLALDCSDLNRRDRSISIQRTLSTKKGKTVISQYPKTASGFRVLKVSPQLMNRLERQVARAKKLHKPGEPALLFPNGRGRIRGEGNFRRDIWRPALQEAGVPLSYTPHSLRHTFASELIAQGVPITQIAYLMGHSNPATTMRIYASIFKRFESQERDLSSLYSPIDLEEEAP